MRQFRMGAFVLLALLGVATIISAMPEQAQARQCAAIIYEHVNYGGRSQCLQPGRYNMNNIKIGNDRLSSVKVGKGYTVYLYEHANFKGRRGTLKTNSSNVGKNWNDITSSIIVQ